MPRRRPPAASSFRTPQKKGRRRNHRSGSGARNEQGQFIPIDVKPGDRVLFGKWSGTEVKIDGQDYLIMKESDLLGVVEKTGSARKAA
jgi:chaperonin GroES